MTEIPERRILIAGAGIAGLTAALAFAAKGFPVSIFERAAVLEEVGAGLQLSPNATRILRELDVLDALQATAVQPDAVVLRRAASLQELARVRLGGWAAERWGAPYLVSHRADLQRAVLDAVRSNSEIELVTSAHVDDFALDAQGASLIVERAGARTTHRGLLVVGADGVWSTLRAHAGDVGKSRFIGQLAWRRTIPADAPEMRELLAFCPGVAVNAFLHPGFHMIAYPVRGGREINLVAFTKFRREMKEGWSRAADLPLLREALAATHPALRGLAAGADHWTVWPIHVADLDGAWIDPAGLALIGDAAHAMTPFAAQGAAMAIEDAWTLANAVDKASGKPGLASALTDWSVARRRRVLRVARRGALNEFAWHARGPVAIARDAFLRLRSSESLAADLDWLYGWKA